jgi:predicted TIM-barrel fold metal-dependent hydrolase
MTRMTLDRGTFLSAVAATAVCGALPAAAQTGAARRIDVHRHVSPPFYAADVKDGFKREFPPPLASWTPATCLADMDASGIELGILSMPARPGVYFGDLAFARTFSRKCNEYMADLRRTYPGRFGLYAVLPLPDVEGSLTELAYALDVLHADGVGAWTSYGQKYLGDPAFAPLWAELNRRNAVVFTHPTDSACCVNPIAPVMGETVVEFGADTTRTIGSLVFSGTAGKYPNIKFIFSHGGGTMPFVIDRFHNQARDPKSAAMLPHGVEYELKRFYYDTAFASSPGAMAALLKLVGPTQIVLGTDFPYNPGTTTVSELAVCGAPARDVAAIVRQSSMPLVGRASLRA